MWWEKGTHHRIFPVTPCLLRGLRDFSDEDVDFGFPKVSVSETADLHQLRLHVELFMTSLLSFRAVSMMGVILKLVMYDYFSV